MNKKSNGKYENEGEIKVNVSDLEGVEQSVMDNVNNMNIKYSGKIDNTNQNIEGNITVNYNDDVNFPVNYKYVNDTLGIQTDYISKKYIGIENKNLKEFAEKFGITDVENVPDKIELDKSTTDKLTADEKKQLNDKYVEIVKEIADKKEFSKTQENGMDKLSVNITNQEIKDLMIKLLETLKDDKDVMSKLDSIYNEYGGVLKKAENLSQDSVGSEESTSSTKDNSLEIHTEKKPFNCNHIAGEWLSLNTPIDMLKIQTPNGENRVLLHSCCAPCSSAIIECMLANGIRPTVFYCNPNIYPQEEYEIRKQEAIRFVTSQNLDFIDADYDYDHWRNAMSGLENEPERGSRCLKCFTLRLTETARYASEHDFQVFTTTLASSRWKNLEQINEAGQRAASFYPGTIFWEQNWRKGGLQDRRNQLLKEYDFYNQLYCGCEFSMKRLEQQKENKAE